MVPCQELIWDDDMIESFKGFSIVNVEDIKVDGQDGYEIKVDNGSGDSIDILIGKEEK